MHRGLNKTLVGIFLVAGMLGLSSCKMQFGWGYNEGFSPDQPIAFDHALHVNQNKIQCLYCHNQVERSPHSSIPPLSTCMNCHLVVKTDSPQIQKLRDAYDKGVSIPWVKVHMLPDHVKFNHSAHLAKGVNCETCHGKVETMKKIAQYQDLSMGWCVNCHREPQYNAPTNCSTCHN
jgi:hypothetical protein